MNTNSPASRTHASPPIIEQLSGRFASSSPIAREGVNAIFESVSSDGRGAFARWSGLFTHWSGRSVDQIRQALRRPAERFGVPPRADCAAKLLFAMQSYFALLVELTAERFAAASVGELLPESPFAWCESPRGKPLGRFVERLRGEIARLAFDSSRDGARDWFKSLYQDIFPRQLRHRLGEYYTPDWLADHVLDQVGYEGDPAASLLDPACGSGTFLIAALRRKGGMESEEGGRIKYEGGRMRDEMPLAVSPPSLFSPHSPLSPPRIAGFDLNPLAVLTARANYLIAVRAMFPDAERVNPPIYLHDSILDRGEAPSDLGPFDFVVGNPPWIAWDNLPEEDRRATKPLWERYGLFSLDGNQARHGGGKKDLSMLMLHATADKYLKTAGRLGMVVTQSVFQTIGAGDGFRRFRLGPDGPPLSVLRVDDMTELRPFDAAARTSTIVVEKGTETHYPVRYVKWKPRGEKGEGSEERGARDGLLRRDVLFEECSARPVDPAKPTSPWFVERIIAPKPLAVLQSVERINAAKPLAVSKSVERINAAKPLAVSQSDAVYTARLGANSGGANGVYWLKVLEQRGDGLLVRNLAAVGKHQLETVETVIEPDLVYPLLRWGNVARYRAEPLCCILLAQDPATRSGIDETTMREKYPRTLDYLERFRETLVARSAYRRYQRRGPFYSMYNIGPYTVAPIRVVWRRMDRQINAAVVEPRADSPLSPISALREKTPIPQETCVLVECGSSDEAHYLCAMLNSRAINRLAAAHGIVGGKSFGTPGMLKYLPIERFDPHNPPHVELAAMSRQIHSAALPAEADATAGLRVMMDELSEAIVANHAA